MTLASQYDHNLTLKMLQIFISAGSDGLEAEDYCHPLCTKHDELAKELETVVHVDYSQGTSYLNGRHLSYRDICTLAEDTYKNQKENGAWPPAKHAQDSHAVPNTFANTLVLTSSGGSSSSFQGKCHKCGKHGHITKKCPTKKPSKHLTPAPRNGKGPRGDDSKKWKYQAPGAGAAQTKDVDGLTFHWCGTCAHWTTSHGTVTHTGPKGTKRSNRGDPMGSLSAAHSANSGPQANMFLVPDPSAWFVSVSSPAPLDWFRFWGYAL